MTDRNNHWHPRTPVDPTAGCETEHKTDLLVARQRLKAFDGGLRVHRGAARPQRARLGAVSPIQLSLAP
jgi:hypothetical protein